LLAKQTLYYLAPLIGISKLNFHSELIKFPVPPYWGWGRKFGRTGAKDKETYRLYFGRRYWR
jgi:hypothetical protein